MKRIGVMHLIDTLELGGAERAAVNLANSMPRDRYRTCLCTTRRDGPLADSLQPDVGRLRLNRTRTLDWSAIRRLIDFIRCEDIHILHAHGSALFVATSASLFSPFPVVVWHDHFGRCAIENRPVWLYRLLARRLAGVIAVNEPLADWSRHRLRVPANRVWYIRNFVSMAQDDHKSVHVPGTPGRRIACVANVRPEKDHATLVRAMAHVVRDAPNAHLLLVGNYHNDDCFTHVDREIRRHKLENHVSLLGMRNDVAAVLRACDIGVLSSTSEGLPLALLEYGMAGLAPVVTCVGQCREVVNDGRCGILVPPHAPDKLAEALILLLRSADVRADLGSRFQHRIREFYSPRCVIPEVCDAYDSLLNERRYSRKQGGHHGA